MTANTTRIEITFPPALENLPGIECAVQSVLSLPASEFASLPSAVKLRHRILVDQLKELKAKVAADELAANPNQGGAK